MNLDELADIVRSTYKAAFHGPCRRRRKSVPHIKPHVAKAMLGIKDRNSFELFACMVDMTKWKLAKVCVRMATVAERLIPDGHVNKKWAGKLLLLMESSKRAYRFIGKYSCPEVFTGHKAELVLKEAAECVLACPQSRHSSQYGSTASSIECASFLASLTDWDTVRDCVIEKMCRMTNTDPDSLATIVVAPAFKDL